MYEELETLELEDLGEMVRKAPPYARQRRRRSRRRPIYQTEMEDRFMGDIWGAITSGVRGWRETSMVERAIANGERSENRLTNLVFHARHPELGGRAIRAGEKALAREWLSIRNSIVRPALSRVTGGGASTGLGRGPAPPSPGGTVPTPTSGRALRNNIVRIAEQEWQRWDRGRRKEWEVAMRPTLEAYWRHGVGWVPTGSNWWSRHPWSAAFISWVMRQAGAGSAFRYSARHTNYVGAAKRNRIANNSNPFKAYRVSEVAPRAGDLVCKERSNSGVTYDNVDKGSFASHSDIVVEVQPGQIKTIGGNLSDSVRKDTVRTSASGRIAESRYYAVVRAGA